MSEQLTRNFNSAEFACHCCNHVGDHDLHPLANALQALRNAINKPVHLNCGYRCPRHNASVGGAPHSQHMEGRAADIVVPGMSPSQVARYAELIPAFRNGGIGIYDTFTHVDIRPNGPARWDLRSKRS
ncbi:MAG TPA: D-Ala-D-Ala carboxypeptidase family metallohydrolase [Armatimonadota bacterium]|nr:D-Ala-D-Ala carboxypeptidase family metallohydrolase [Armatimonadota bacterium]